MLDLFEYIKNMNFDILLPESLEGIRLFLFSVGVLCLINLWCFIDIIGFLISLYILKYMDLDSKYPKLKPIVKYFANSNYIFIGIQVAYIFIIHIFILIVCISIYFS